MIAHYCAEAKERSSPEISSLQSKQVHSICSRVKAAFGIGVLAHIILERGVTTQDWVSNVLSLKLVVLLAF